MTPSARGITFVQWFEKCWKPIAGRPGLFAAYLPTPNDNPTIGYGTTGGDITLETIWSQAECDTRFAADLAKFGAGVWRAIDGAATTQAQFDAMSSLAYNIGLGNFAQSTVLRLHKAADYAGAAAAFAMWNQQDGVVLAGLTARRAAEAALYRNAVVPAPRSLTAADNDLHGLL